MLALGRVKGSWFRSSGFRSGALGVERPNASGCHSPKERQHPNDRGPSIIYLMLSRDYGNATP